MMTFLSRHIEGGLPVGPDGRIHTTYKHDPSTMRLSAAAPNMTNIPRGSSDLQKLVRGFFVTPEGFEFVARDFSGIEGVLTGFFANAPRIIRLFKLDGHSYFTAYAEYELNKTLTYADLPQESWPDDQLKGRLAEIKKQFKPVRETNKKVTHGANYMETAAMAQVILLNELGVLYPIKEIAKIMEFYHELFPEIRRWHSTLVSEVGGAKAKVPPQRWGFEARNCFVRNPFGLPHRYYDVVKWEKGPGGWDWSFGDDAKRLASFLPQSTARFILTRAAQRMAQRDPKLAKTFRLFVHDELLAECRLGGEGDRFLQLSQEEMERPVDELVMPDGTLLAIGTEAKRGRVWGEMR